MFTRHTTKLASSHASLWCAQNITANLGEPKRSYQSRQGPPAS